MTGTFINVGTVLLGTLIGVAVGRRLPERLQQRVMAGLGLLTGVIGMDLALPPKSLNFLYVMGGVLILGISLKLLNLVDVKVGNFLPALVLAPALVGIVAAVR